MTVLDQAGAASVADNHLQEYAALWSKNPARSHEVPELRGRFVVRSLRDLTASECPGSKLPLSTRSNGTT